MKPLLAIALLLFMFPTVIVAQENAASSSAVTEAIRERIKALVDSDSNPERLVWIGTVSSLQDGGFELRTPGQTLLVSVTDATQIISRQGQAVTLEDIIVDGPTLVLGARNNQDVISALKIELLTELPSSTNKSITIGVVESVTSRAVTVLTSLVSDAVSYQFTRNSALLSNFSDNPDSLEYRDLDEGMQVLLISRPSTTNPDVLQLSTLVTIPVATGSATP